MSDADKAYEAAQRLIAEVLASGDDSLDLDTEETHALTTLPPEIAELTGITALFLSNTQITDLAPLVRMEDFSASSLPEPLFKDIFITGFHTISDAPVAALAGISTLSIDNTQITDLRPLFALPELEQGNHLFSGGLDFQNTPATKIDLKLAELSKIKGDYERTTKTFAYLREVGDDWPPLLASAPDQDTILTVTQTEDGRLDISPATPDAEELTDTVKRKAHQRLQQATKSLEQIAGNMHPRLSSTARTLSLHIDCPLQEVDMLDVHFELEALRGTYQRRGERKGEDIFGDDVVDALDKVLMIGPGLVLDNEQVEKLEARRDRYRGAPPTPDVQAAQDHLSDGIALDPALFGDTIRSYSVTFKEGHAEGSERLQAGQGILNKNTLIYVGTIVVSGMAGGPLSGLGNNLLAWFIAQSETISILARTWGTVFEAWITPIMMRAREANVAVRGLLNRPD